MEIRSTDRHHVCATWHNLLVIVWWGEIELDTVVATVGVSEQVFRSTGHKVVSLVVIEEGVPIPDSPIRRAVSSTMDNNSEFAERSANVIAGEGFWAAAARAVLTGIITVTRSPTPRKTFKHAQEALAWLAPSIGAPRLDVDDLHAMVRGLRDKAHAHRAA